MACAHPVSRGEKSLGLTRPCGVCMQCRRDYVRSKAVRAVHELDFWPTSSFLTLTYETPNLPYLEGAIMPTVLKRDFQLFIKRLRKSLEPSRISYIGCGEYGDRNERPHYHALIYGYDFPDREFLEKSKGSGEDLYVSNQLNKLWEFKGKAVIGKVTYDSAAYVAGYTLKKQNGENAKQLYDATGRHPPFGLMSKKPAIGKRWIEKWFDEVVDHDAVYVNGAKQQPPRYYDEYIKKWAPLTFKEIKEGRIKRAQDRLDTAKGVSPGNKNVIMQNKNNKKIRDLS